MGVCASSEAKPEKDLNSDGLAKEHFNKEVLGENFDSSTHGYIVFSDFIFSTALFLTLNAKTPDPTRLTSELGKFSGVIPYRRKGHG